MRLLTNTSVPNRYMLLLLCYQLQLFMLSFQQNLSILQWLGYEFCFISLNLYLQIEGYFYVGLLLRSTVYLYGSYDKKSHNKSLRFYLQPKHAVSLLVKVQFGDTTLLYFYVLGTIIVEVKL